MDDETEQMLAAMERRRFLAIGAAAAMLGLVGCGDKQKKKPKTPAAVLAQGATKVEKRIKKYVKDKPRRKKALALMDKARAEMKSVMGLVDESRDARGRLPLERQTREELLVVIEEYDAKIRGKLLGITDACVELRTVITKPEWSLIFTEHKSKEAA